MKGLAVIGGIALVVAVVILEPALYFILGAIAGWLMSNVIIFAGNWLVDGMALFGIHLTLATLPLFTGTLAFIGSYFKNTLSSSKK